MKNDFNISVEKQIDYLIKKLNSRLDIPYGDIVFSIRGGRVYKIAVERSFLVDRIDEDGERVSVESSNFGQKA